MKTDTIPLREKFDALVSGLAELEPIAAELSRDAVHKQSPHISGVLMRIRGGIEGLGWHAKFLADLPDPAVVQPQPKIVPDAKAGQPAK